MGNPPPEWLVKLGSDIPATDEYFAHPDHRQYAAFFLGWLFILSQILFFTSPTLASIVLRLKRAHNAEAVERRSSDYSAEKLTFSTTYTNRSDAFALVLLLNLLIVTTSATQFASVLAFNTVNGKTSCVFLIAWSGLGAQTVRLIGFLKLSLHLRELGARRWETWGLWALLLVAAVAMFLANAVSTGTLKPVPGVEAFSLCYRKHFAFTAAVTSGLNLFIECYLIIRFIFLQLPFFAMRRDRRTFADLRLLRTTSLLVLDLLTIYPSIHFVNIAADYIPGAIGMILVLLSFNYYPASGYSIFSSGWSTTTTSTAPPLPPNEPSVRSFEPVLPMHTPPSTFRIGSSEYAVNSTASPKSIYLSPQPHPFGASALSNRTTVPDYQMPSRRADEAVRPPPIAIDSRPLLFVPMVDSKPPSVIDISAGTGPPPEPLNTASTTSIGSKRRSFLPALPTMAWGAEGDIPLQIDPAQPLPIAAVTVRPSTSNPRGRKILPNQAEVGARLTPQGSLSVTPPLVALASQSNTASASIVPPLSASRAPSRLPRTLLPSTELPLSFDRDYVSGAEIPHHDVPTMPTTPNSVMYGSDVLSPSPDVINMMKHGQLLSRGGHLSQSTTTQRTSGSTFGVGAATIPSRHSATESMLLNYPFGAIPLSPGNGELTASSTSQRPSTADDASNGSEDARRRPNTFGNESFLDLKMVANSSSSSTKTKSSSRTSRSDRHSQSNSGDDETLGSRARREKGKGSKKGKRTQAGVSSREQQRRSVDPAPLRMTALENASS